MERSDGTHASDLMGSVPDSTAALWLVCRVGDLACAIPLENVREIMRGLPIDPLPGMPSFVLGLSIIRGTPAPVVDAGLLLGDQACKMAWMVTLNVGDRGIALVVDGVLGVRTIEAELTAAMPPLLRNAAAVAAAIGVLDSELLLFLNIARCVPEALIDLLLPSGTPDDKERTP